MRGGTRAYPGVCGHALAPTGMVGRARAYAGMGGYARVCVGARGCVRLWLGVFSNNYEFSEYLLETKVFMKWPLIRILFEFFFSIPMEYSMAMTGDHDSFFFQTFLTSSSNFFFRAN